VGCCSLYDESEQAFCDAWPPSLAPGGGSCTSAPWPCLFEKEYGKIKTLMPYESPVLWPYFAGAGILMLLVACACANLRWMHNQAQKKKAKQQRIRRRNNSSKDVANFLSTMDTAASEWSMTSPTELSSLASPTVSHGSGGFRPGSPGLVSNNAQALEDLSRENAKGKWEDSAARPESAEKTSEPPLSTGDLAQPLPTISPETVKAVASTSLKALANMSFDESSDASSCELKHPALRAADFTHLAAIRKQQHVPPPLHAQSHGPSVVMAVPRTRSQRLQPQPGWQAQERRKHSISGDAASRDHHGSREALRNRLADSLRKTALDRDEPGDALITLPEKAELRWTEP